MSKGSLLLVDDNPIVLQVLKSSLEDAGYQVAALSSAFQINSAIREHLPDLILLDVNMPALRGDRVASILGQRKFASEIPILLISDSEESELRALVEETGAAGFIRKSSDHGPMLATVARHLVVKASSQS